MLGVDVAMAADLQLEFIYLHVYQQVIALAKVSVWTANVQWWTEQVNGNFRCCSVFDLMLFERNKQTEKCIGNFFWRVLYMFPGLRPGLVIYFQCITRLGHLYTWKYEIFAGWARPLQTTMGISLIIHIEM